MGDEPLISGLLRVHHSVDREGQGHLRGGKLHHLSAGLAGESMGPT